MWARVRGTQDWHQTVCTDAAVLLYVRRYEKGTPKLSAAAIVPPAEGMPLPYIVDDEKRLYYAGDYCSAHTPGVEAAVLSAMGAAHHIANTL